MKEFLFVIIVMLLTPVYIAIKLFRNAIDFLTQFFEPVIDGINVLIENMFEFWRKIFKGEK